MLVDNNDIEKTTTLQNVNKIGQKQFRISEKCFEHIKNYAEKLFSKCFHFVKESKSGKQKAKKDAFIYALSALTILSNFGVDVNDQVDMLEDAFISSELFKEKTKQKTCKIQRKHQHFTENKKQKCLGTVESRDSLCEKDQEANEVDLQHIIGMRCHYEEKLLTSKKKKTIEDRKSSLKKGIEPQKHTLMVVEEEVEESVEDEIFSEDSESYVPSRKSCKHEDLDTLLKKDTGHDDFKKTDLKTDTSGQRQRSPIRRRKSQIHFDKEEVLSKIKDFLEEQNRESQTMASPSLCLESLALALQDPSKLSKAELVLSMFEKEFSILESDPFQLIMRIRDQLDSGKLSGKATPIDKMFNLLSVLLGSETNESVAEELTSNDEGLSKMTLLEKAEFYRQKTKILQELADDVETQLKYNQAVINSQKPSQRAIWFTLQSQAEVTRECCEKIVFLYSQNAVTSKLASNIVEDFILNILDCIAILENDELLSDNEQNTVYGEIKDMFNVINLFILSSSCLSSRLQPFLHLDDDDPTVISNIQTTKQQYDLNVKLPSSYDKLIDSELLANFLTTEFLTDRYRIPLETIYTDLTGHFNDERKKMSDFEEKLRLKKKLELKARKTVMTQNLADIKKTFKDPSKHLDPNSPLCRIGRQLRAGISQLSDQVDGRFRFAEAERDIMAYETDKIQISGEHSTYESKELQKKEIAVIQARYSSTKKPLILLEEETYDLIDEGEIRTNDQQYLTKSKAGETTDDIAILPPSRIRRQNLTVESDQPFIITSTPQRSIQRQLYPLKFAQKPSRRKMLGRRTKGSHALLPEDSKTHSYEKSKHITVSSLEARAVNALRSLQDVKKQANGRLHKEARSKINPIQYSVVTSEESDSQMETTSVISSVQMMTPTSKLRSMSEAASPFSFRVFQHKPYNARKTPRNKSKSVFDLGPRSLGLTSEKDVEQKSPSVWTCFDKVLASRTVSSPISEELIRKMPKKEIPVSEQMSDKDQQSEQLGHWPLDIGEETSNQQCTAAILDLVENFNISKLVGKKLFGTLDRRQKEPINDGMKFHSGSLAAVRHLQYMLPAEELTRLLTEIKSRNPTPETIKLFENILLKAVQKAQYSGCMEAVGARGQSKILHVDLNRTRIPVKSGLPLKQSDALHSMHKKSHCRYETLARKRYQNLGLSISAHIERMQLVERIHKSIQQRANQRIQNSIEQCLSKFI
ncbi:unnamed protein product [Heterobilharzia americana]|nr:unnamed protein product [Heterobilharzia americana]